MKPENRIDVVLDVAQISAQGIQDVNPIVGPGGMVPRTVVKDGTVVVLSQKGGSQNALDGFEVNITVGGLAERMEKVFGTLRQRFRVTIRPDEGEMN